MLRMQHMCALLVVVAGTASADGIFRCDGCSSNTEKNTVKGAGYGYHYVFDMTEGRANRYHHYFDRDANRAYVVSVDSPASLQNYLSNYIYHYNNYKSALSAQPNLLKPILDEVLGIPTALITNVSSPSCNSDRPQDAKIHNFLVNSALRRDVYNKTVLYYPSIQNAFNAWNNLVSHVDFSAGGVGVNTNMFAISQSIMFADGATVGVVANPAYLTFDIVPGSAVDCNGNNIPLPSESLTGDYRFTTADDARRFSDYAQYFGASVGNYPVCSATSLAKCTWNGITKRYSCNFICL